MCSMGVNKFMKLRARLNKLIFIYYHIPSLDSFNDILSFLHAYNFEHANHWSAENTDHLSFSDIFYQWLPVLI